MLTTLVLTIVASVSDVSNQTRNAEPLGYRPLSREGLAAMRRPLTSEGRSTGLLCRSKSSAEIALPGPSVSDVS